MAWLPVVFVMLLGPRLRACVIIASESDLRQAVSIGEPCVRIVTDLVLAREVTVSRRRPSHRRVWCGRNSWHPRPAYSP